jgi:Tol biopolymer transport system component
MGAVAAGVAAGLLIQDRTSRENIPPIVQGGPLPARASAIVFALSRYVEGVSAGQEDVWLYDVRTDRTRRLTKSGGREREILPRFRGDKEISFILHRVAGTPAHPQVRDSVVIMNTATGAKREVTAFDGEEVIDHRWSSDGAKLALVLRDVAAGERHNLRIFDSKDGSVRDLPVLGPTSGRGKDLDDEVSLAWSSTDSSLLVVDTFLQAKESVLLVDVASGSVSLSVDGTNARLSPDARTLYFRDREAAPTGQARWYQMDVSSRSRSPLDATSDTHNAALSRDGRYLAHVYGENPSDMTLYLYDIIGKTERAITREYSDALWVSREAFVATKLEGCSGATCDSPSIAIATSRFSLSGRSKSIDLGSTLRPNVDVFYS